MFSDLIGKPYSPLGVGPHSYDCLGLMMEVGRRLEWPFELPPMDLPEIGWRARAERYIAEEFPKVFCEIKRASQVGDVLFMSGTKTEPWHVAVLIEPGRAIHSVRESGCVVAPISFLMPRVLHSYRVAVTS